LFVSDSDFSRAKSDLSPSALLKINFVEGTRTPQGLNPNAPPSSSCMLFEQGMIGD
jgi:hypothetical protein